jgi:hypothetical protein
LYRGDAVPWQALFPLGGKAGIVDVGAIGEIGEIFEADIDADLFLAWGTCDRLDLLAADAHKPLARRGAFDDGGLGRALDGSVHDQLDMADLGEDELPFVVAFIHQSKTAVIASGGILREGQAMIAQARLEPRIAYLLAGCSAAKKGLESEIDALDDVLQDLGQFWVDILTCRQFCALVGKAKGEARHAIGIAPLLQGVIIDLAA